MSAPSRLVIGVGHEQRGDDAIGLLVARHLSAGDALQRCDDLRIVEHDGDGMDLVLLWEGAERVVLIDAVVSGRRASGEVERFEAHREPLPTRLFGAHSTHALGVAEAIELARAMETLPSCVVVYGVEAARFETGSAPSARVRACIEGVSGRVLEELGLAGDRCDA